MSGYPDYVYINKGRCFLREPGCPEIKLGPDTMTKAEAWKAYLALPPREKVGDKEPLTLRRLFGLFQESPQWMELSANTRRDAKSALRVMCRQPTKAGREFGDYLADNITVVVMRLYMDKRGAETKKRANAEMSYASMAYAWGFERGHVKGNPCLGLKRYAIKARERLVTDEEYAERYALAGELGRQDVQVMMELAYLCRLRENEILKMIDSPHFIREVAGVLAAVLAVRGKGSKTQLITATPRLQAAIDHARRLKPQAELTRTRRRRPLVSTLCLIVNRFGRPLTLSGFSQAWQDIQAEAARRGHATDWHFHDLKAKGVSDFEGDQHKASGNKTQQMSEVYRRNLETVPGTR